MGDIRNDINGLRVKLPLAPAVFLIDKGKKRVIPNPQVYNDLFRGWEDIFEDLDVDEIVTGDPLPETAMLFKCIDSPKVFLLDGDPPNQVKRHIVSPAVMDRYKFDWRKITKWNTPLAVIGIPDGPPITNP